MFIVFLLSCCSRACTNLLLHSQCSVLTRRPNFWNHASWLNRWAEVPTDPWITLVFPLCSLHFLPARHFRQVKLSGSRRTLWSDLEELEEDKRPPSQQSQRSEQGWIWSGGTSPPGPKNLSSVGYDFLRDPILDYSSPPILVHQQPSHKERKKKSFSNSGAASWIYYRKSLLLA
jgi:hypothetical protein